MKLTNRKAASILCEFYGRISLIADISFSSDAVFAYRVAVKALYFGTTRTHEEESIKLINETIDTLTQLVGELIIQYRVEINDQELEAFRLAINTLEECKTSQYEEGSWSRVLEEYLGVNQNTSLTYRTEAIK